MNEIGLIKKHGFQSEPQTIGHDNYFEKKNLFILGTLYGFFYGTPKGTIRFGIFVKP